MRRSERPDGDVRIHLEAERLKAVLATKFNVSLTRKFCQEPFMKFIVDFSFFNSLFTDPNTTGINYSNVGVGVGAETVK